jgi:hypothetical protein
LTRTAPVLKLSRERQLPSMTSLRIRRSKTRSVTSLQALMGSSQRTQQLRAREMGSSRPLMIRRQPFTSSTLMTQRLRISRPSLTPLRKSMRACFPASATLRAWEERSLTQRSRQGLSLTSTIRRKAFTNLLRRSPRTRSEELTLSRKRWLAFRPELLILRATLTRPQFRRAFQDTLNTRSTLTSSTMPSSELIKPRRTSQHSRQSWQDSRASSIQTRTQC